MTIEWPRRLNKNKQFIESQEIQEKKRKYQTAKYSVIAFAKEKLEKVDKGTINHHIGLSPTKKAHKKEALQ